MPLISRDKDLARTGHTCTFTVPVQATQGSVFVNNIPLLRRGDPCKTHFIRRGIKCVGHRAKVNRGSNTVFAENIPVARRGDSTDFGKLIRSSFNVHAGG